MESSTDRRKSFKVFMPQDSRRRAGITTFLNCQKSKATRFFGRTGCPSLRMRVSKRRLAVYSFLLLCSFKSRHRFPKIHLAVRDAKPCSGTRECRSAVPVENSPLLRKKSVRDEFVNKNLRETLDCSH